MQYRHHVGPAQHTYLLLLEKLTGSPHFMEPECSLTHSHMPVTCPYLDPRQTYGIEIGVKKGSIRDFT